MKILRTIIVVGSVGLLTACQQPLEVKSHTYDLERIPDRLLVIQTTSYTVPKPKENNEFKTEFAGLLQACGIPTAFAVNNDTLGKSIFSDSISQNADVETAKINELKPTFVFNLKELSAHTKGTVTTIDFEAVLIDTSRKKQIWRATGFVRKTPLLNRITLQDLARGFVDQMRADKILQSCPAAPPAKNGTAAAAP